MLPADKFVLIQNGEFVSHEGRDKYKIPFITVFPCKVPGFIVLPETGNCSFVF